MAVGLRRSIFVVGCGVCLEVKAGTCGIGFGIRI
jgi:hypothetical protein